jgi:hypothetical protein
VTSDLLINLFKGYGAVSNEVFPAWLLRKQDHHKEGEEMTPDDLMIAAKNKYNSMMERGSGIPQANARGENCCVGALCQLYVLQK